MGLAPEPGVGARLDATEAAKAIMVVTVAGETRRFAPNNLPFDQRLAVRKATGGIPFEQFWSGELAMGMDSVVLLWWVAGRVEGVKGETLEGISEQFSRLTSEAFAIDLEVPDEADDHPEA